MTVYKNLLDTDNCPLGFRCEQCGKGYDVTRPHKVTPIVGRTGVFCMTLCPGCAALPALLATPARPSLNPHTVINLIADHAAHLGVTVELIAILTKEGAHV